MYPKSVPPPEATGNTRHSGSRTTSPVRVHLGNERSSGWGGDDVLTGFERITGGPRHDRLIGDDGPNIINGRSGDDYIEGGGGADVLRGGSGNNRCRGVSADDRVASCAEIP